MSSLPCRRTLSIYVAFSTLTCMIMNVSTPLQAMDGKTITLKIGIIPGPEEALAEVAAQEAKKQGVIVKLIEFQDYSLPNEALNSAEIDANAFQHIPFMQVQIKTRGYKIEPLGATWIQPMGVYSSKYKKIEELPDKSIIGIPNDPSNQDRALRLLAKHALLTLAGSADGRLLSLADVGNNPHQLKFYELDASQLPRSLPDVDIAAINTNYLASAEINPNSALIREDITGNPYANVIAVRVGHKNQAGMDVLLKSFQSDAVKEAILKQFHGVTFPAW